MTTTKTTTTKKATAKTTKAKEPRPKAKRLPAETFMAELERLSVSKSEAARRLGVSTSTIAEWSGTGRKRLLRADRWPEVKRALARPRPKVVPKADDRTAAADEAVA